MTATVRRIRPGEGPLLKRVRLAALLDAPTAFAKTHAEASTYTDDEWENRAAAWAAGDGGLGG